MKNGLQQRLRRGVFTLVTLCAVLFQAAVVQAHVHVASPLHQIEATDASHAPAAAGGAALKAHAVCAYCHALSAGRALDCVAPPLLAQRSAAQSCGLTHLSNPLAPPPAHPWNSRAPPARL